MACRSLTLGLFRQLMQVLQHAHLRGIVHRDVKLRTFFCHKKLYPADWASAGEWRADQLQICRGAAYVSLEVDMWSADFLPYGLCRDLSEAMPAIGSAPRGSVYKGETEGYLRQYNSKPWLDRKKGSADLQAPVPYYTPFDFIGGHWHRWYTRTPDPTGMKIPKEFDERDVKDTDYWGESFPSKMAGYILEGSAWDDEWFVERAPLGFYADFFDPVWESMQRSAKIFNDEDMPRWWQNRFRAFGFYFPLIIYFSRRAIRKIWRFETKLSIRTDGRRSLSFARRMWYGLGIKRRRKLGPKKRRRIGVLTWRRLLTGALIFLPIPFFVEQVRRDTTPFAYAIAFGVAGLFFGPQSILSAASCAAAGWFWGAGKEFVQRFEGATMSYLRDTEKLKNEYVNCKIDAIKERLPAPTVAKLRLNRVSWLDEHKRDGIGHPWAPIKDGHWDDPSLDTRELNLYPDYEWFRPALWRPYMWYIRPYEPVVPDPRSPFNPEDEEAFKAAHRPQALANTADRESLAHWFRLREELLTDEHEVPDVDEDTDQDDEIDEEDFDLENEGPAGALEMEQDEEEEAAAGEDLFVPELYKTWNANDFSRARDILHSADYDWEPAPELPRFRPEVFAPRDPDDPSLVNDKPTWEDYDNEDYEEFGLRHPDEEHKARYWRELH